jgi:hypothetical protein
MYFIHYQKTKAALRNLRKRSAKRKKKRRAMKDRAYNMNDTYEEDLPDDVDGNRARDNIMYFDSDEEYSQYSDNDSRLTQVNSRAKNSEPKNVFFGRNRTNTKKKVRGTMIGF